MQEHVNTSHPEKVDGALTIVRHIGKSLPHAAKPENIITQRLWRHRTRP
jgi:hypothetical protein